MKATAKSLFVVCLFTIFGFGIYFGRAKAEISNQTNAREVQYLFTNSGAMLGEEPVPISIVQISRNRELSPVGQVILGDTDWLAATEVKLKNDSSKDIKFAQLRVDLLDPQTNAIIAGAPGFTISRKLAPGQEQTGSVLAYALSSLRSGLSDSRLPFKRVVVSVDIVEFSDGTSWKYGLLHRQDPNDPNRWVPILAHKQSGSYNKPSQARVINASFTKNVVGCDKYFHGYLSGRYCSQCGCIVYDEDWRFTPNGIGPATAGYIPWYCSGCKCTKIGLIAWC